MTRLPILLVAVSDQQTMAPVSAWMDRLVLSSLEAPDLGRGMSLRLPFLL